MSRVNLQLAQRLSYVDWAVALTDTGIDKYPIAENCRNRMKTFERIISWWGTGNSDFVDRIKRAHNLIETTDTIEMLSYTVHSQIVCMT